MIFQTELQAMRKMVKLSGETAAPAEVGAEAAGSSQKTPAKTPNKSAAEPSDVDRKRARASTPSTKEPAKRNRGVGARGQR